MKPINISNLNEPFYFLDFESDKNGNIYLMGTLTPEGLTIYVTDPKLRAMVANETFRKKYNVTFIDLERALQFFIETITSNRGTLVAYSDYELEVIKNILPSFEWNISYLNLRTAAKKWINKYHKNKFKDLGAFRKNADKFRQRSQKFSLASVMRLLPMEFQSDTDYAPGKTTKRINSIIKGLNNSRNNQNYANLTPTKKRDATMLLKHNAFDVESLPVLLKEINKDDEGCLSKATKLKSNSPILCDQFSKVHNSEIGKSL